VAKGQADGGPTELAKEIEATREHLASTIDELLYRVHPKTVVGREVYEVKAFFVDPATGQPRTDNILKVVGTVVGTVALFALIRRVTR
jgi:hypothetical protein